MLRCRLGWHKWTKWQRVHKSQTTRPGAELFLGQMRTCSACGLIDTRTVSDNRDYVWILKQPAPAQEAGGPKSTTNNNEGAQ